MFDIINTQNYFSKGQRLSNEQTYYKYLNKTVEDDEEQQSFNKMIDNKY